MKGVHPFFAAVLLLCSLLAEAAAPFVARPVAQVLDEAIRCDTVRLLDAAVQHFCVVISNSTLMSPHCDGLVWVDHRTRRLWRRGRPCEGAANSPVALVLSALARSPFR
jgi:hypothetical protein